MPLRNGINEKVASLNDNDGSMRRWSDFPIASLINSFEGDGKVGNRRNITCRLKRTSLNSQACLKSASLFFFRQEVLDRQIMSFPETFIEWGLISELSHRIILV